MQVKEVLNAKNMEIQYDDPEDNALLVMSFQDPFHLQSGLCHHAVKQTYKHAKHEISYKYITK